ncbi:sugar ABC transporter ATP-binding protein [Mesorhizobium sp. INR15]|uniref:sugar ABC transporter ATP-binding protein n=1 Tax=Mesorhizobium sp. INR15 TaxID=2654248 RepID=UPI0018966FC9|nr:sugar ABC transporter ATP-binding protein [Mesorhizobium sp. INR15]QPC95536.1 ATP-binding cassette domain-containing protein [Mesorhizobium sp. INR15]
MSPEAHQNLGAAPPPAESLAPVCRLVGVGKRFGGIWACRSVDLAIRPGEVHAVMGENGAGKSTLMKMLHGVYVPDEGQVEVAGRVVSLTSPRAAEAAGIAMVPQELDLFPDLSVVENLFVGRVRPRTRFGTFDWDAMRRQAAAAFQRLNATFDIDATVRSLSGANAQMVEIARALMHEAKIVILDEPTSALTEREAQRLFGIVGELTRRGVAIIYISHRLDEVFQITDRITVMRDGERIHTGRTSELDMAQLIQMMVGRPLSKLFHRTPHPTGEALLEVQGLGRTGVFKDISFTLRRGEIVGMSGLIGAGRSEVAQAIFGIAPATEGSILIAGRPIIISNASAAIGHGIIYVPEERRSQGLVLDYPIDWNISFSGLDRISRSGFVSLRREREIAERFRSLFTIRSSSLKAPVLSLSGGNQQKVLLAKALAVEPEIILLDEPTRGVDVGAKAEIYRIIDDLAAAGKAVLIVSSEMNELLSMADRILVMHQGRLNGNFQGPDFSADAIGAAAAGVVAEATEDPALHPGSVQ